MDVRKRSTHVLLGTAFVFLASSCGQSTATNAAGTGPPSAPTAVSAIAGTASATVSWTAPRSNSSSITRYTVMWSGGSQSCTGSPCLVTELTIGTIYTFTVTATNAAGTGPASAPSNSVTPTPAPSPPPGGPVPAKLLGDWFLPPEATIAALRGRSVCPTPPSATTCFFRLTLTATAYYLLLTAGAPQQVDQGDVVVNEDELDFFNGVTCGVLLPDGVGRYKWTLTGGVLSFTLISDQCSRADVYPTQGWSRTP